jgi:hypothetical protein
MRKSLSPVWLDLASIEVFEGAKSKAMDGNDNRHHLSLDLNENDRAWRDHQTVVGYRHRQHAQKDGRNHRHYKRVESHRGEVDSTHG